jgi:hypothetical protein
MSVVTYGAPSALNSRGPSPIIWKDCPVADYEKDPALGQHVFEDFQNAITMTSNTTTTDFTSGVGQVLGVIPWYVYAESDKLADVALQADNDGVILLQNDGTDADVTSITSGGNTAGGFKTPTAGGAMRKLWFEARIKPVTVTDSDGGFFVGLAQPGEAKDAGGAMAAGGASLSDVDHVGFAQLSGDGDALKLAYNEATSGTAQTGAAGTLAAATWIRVGFKIEFRQQGGMELRWYVNGVDLGDSLVVNLNGTNANWPGATDMDILLAYVGESGVADGDGIYVDWVRCAEQYV